MGTFRRIGTYVKKAGENLCTLLALIRSAERCGVNPLTYLTDVLVREQTRPASDLDALLPIAGA